MITPEDIRKKAVRIMPEVLSAWILGNAIFPYVIRSNKKPTKEDFQTLKSELGELLRSSKEKVGHGYKIELETIKTRSLGQQNLPSRIIFESESDFWKFLRMEKEWKSFQKDVMFIREKIPVLESWIIRNPGKILANSGKWPELLSICEYFCKNPKPKCFIRELPVPVHTKFVESNKDVLDGLLRELIPEHVNDMGKTFESRFNLLEYEQFIHLRILDDKIANQYFSGLTTIGITPTELSTLPLPCDRIIILENKASYSNIENFLTIPHFEKTIALFGSGFKSGILQKIEWLKQKELYYWGDIDAQGFEILSMLRTYFPNIKSIMMDEETFETFPKDHVNGQVSNVKIELNLTSKETTLYFRLRTMQSKNRLEQEKISNDYVSQSLHIVLR